MTGPEDFEDLDAEQEEDEAAQLAEDAADGAVCSLCGTEFDPAHGYPVLCKDCWSDPNNRTEGLQEATNPEVT